MQSAPGGAIESLAGPIGIAEYDDRWPRDFERLRSCVLAQLGATALAIDHVGSTAVPGLAAKPVIDAVLSVANAAQEADYAAALCTVGFELRIREPGWFEHRMFQHHDPAANLHVFTSGCPETARMKLFRDWLRGCLEDRTRYERTKRALAQRH